MSVALLVLSMNGHTAESAAEGEKTLFQQESRSIVDKSIKIGQGDKSGNILSGLYNINFNKQFNILAEVEPESDRLYINRKYIEKSLFDKFQFEKFIVIRGGQEFIYFDKSLVTQVNNSDMTMSVILGSDFFDEKVLSKRLGYIEKGVEQIDTRNVVDYLSNNYQVNLDNFNSLSGYLNTKYSSKDYWSLQNKILYNNDNFVRVGTVYKKDFKNKSSLQVGDIVEDGFGQLPALNGLGVKYATNYFSNIANSNVLEALPQFSINGFSLTPSLFNLYSNSQNFISNEINSGNYNIIMPYHNGYGVYNGYIKDYLGNVQQFSIPYYNSNKLVKPGNFEYSVSAAAIRKNIYERSFDYGKSFASVVAKYGINQNITQDFAAHYSPYFQNIYMGTNFYLNPSWGLFQVGLNYNGDNQKLYNLNWELNSNSPFFFRLSSSRASGDKGFCVEYLDSCIEKQNRYFMGYSLPEGLGQISYQKLEEKKTFSDISSHMLMWTKSIANQLNVSLIYEQIDYKNLTRNKEDKRFVAILNYSFENRVNGSVNYQNSSNYNSYQARIARGEDSNHPEYGYGYASIGKTSLDTKPNYNVNYFANLNHFSYSVQAAKYNDSSYNKLGMRGSVLYIPEDNLVSFNKSTEGIVLVDTGESEGAQNIDIYHQNKYSGTTDNRGRYIITKSVPYAKEKIELDLRTLPLDKNYEQFKYEVVVPEYGAAKVKFKKIMADYSIVINNLPEGSIFTIGNESYMVGKGGETSVNKEGLATLQSENKNCSFEVKQSVSEYSCN